MPNEQDEISAATRELLAKIKNPLDAESTQIVARTLQRLETIGVQGVLATSDQLEQIKVEAKALYATLASIGDAAKAEVEQLFAEKLISVAAALTGRLLVFA